LRNRVGELQKHVGVTRRIERTPARQVEASQRRQILIGPVDPAAAADRLGVGVGAPRPEALDGVHAVTVDGRERVSVGVRASLSTGGDRQC